MVYKEILNNIIEELYELKERYSKELENAPIGELNIKWQNDRHYFSVRIPKEGNRKKVRRKGISSDMDQVMQLVRKKYLKGALKRLERDIYVIKTAIDKYQEINEEAVMESFLERYPELEPGIRYGLQSDEAWAADYTMPENFHEESRKSTAATGIDMRSKSEIIIASRLDFFKIPYRYEEQTRHPDLNRIPDFTIRRPRDGKIVYWEHVGMVNDEGYMEDLPRKLTEYEVNGIVPWDNLILTYDKDNNGIDVRIIDGMIHGWLL